MVILRKDLLARSHENLPGYLNFNNHAKEDSMWNTPPTFAVYVLGLVTEWVEKTIGGLEAMVKINQEKAKFVYDAIDRHPSMYLAHAQKTSRSLMNATFRFPNEEFEKSFLTQAQALGLDSLKGHRSVGGIRASIYNAMPMAGVQSLAQLMDDFAAKNA